MLEASRALSSPVHQASSGWARQLARKRIRLEVGVVNRCRADLARAIRAEAQAFERPVDAVQRCFDRRDALVGELGHGLQSNGVTRSLGRITTYPSNGDGECA